MSLPPRRQRERSNILCGPKREWPRHRKWVRGHACSVPGCEDGPIEFAHVRTAANAGTALRPHDAFAISLCAAHHREQHQVGSETFERRYKINMASLAAEFARKSPDFEMRGSLALASPPNVE